MAVEDPVYSYARLLFQNLGKELVPLRLDPFGSAPLDAWSAALERTRPALFYAITSYQNPTGSSYATYEIVPLLEMS